MAELPKPPLVVKDAEEAAVDMRRTYRNGLRQRLGKDADVGPGSDFYITSIALGNEIAVIGANGILRGDAMMPDSAVGADLARQGDIVERTKRPAVGSYGVVQISASQSTAFETGRQLTDASGLRFEATKGGPYDDDGLVPIRAISTGAATNHAAGDKLQWVSAPPFCDSSVTVYEGGLINGYDAEDDESFRSRILAVYQEPPGGGNWQQAAEEAEDSYPSVQKAFVYPVHQGAGTMGVAVVAAPTATSKSRAVANAVLEGYVKPFVYGKFPVPPEGLNVTTVAGVATDVAIALALPDAPTAQPPGPGGGWLDGSPWPAPDGTSTFKVAVTSAASDSQFTVDAQTPPTAYVTRIAWLSPFDWKLYTAVVTSVSGSAGAYTVTVDAPFSNVAAGCLIWPACENAQAYVDAVLAHFARLGPGEKSSNVSVLRRGFRHPTPSAAADSWPYSLGPTMLRALTDVGDDVYSAAFLYRTDSTTTITGGGGLLTPQPPAALTDPPIILVPQHIAFYKLSAA